MLIIEEPCRIDNTVKFVSQDVKIGCYTTIHENTLIYGDAPVKIGRCCWIGRGAIINATGSPLVIKDGVAIGFYSQIFNHFKGGDRLLGTRFHREFNVVIEKDAWIGAGAVVGWSVPYGTLVPPNSLWTRSSHSGIIHLQKQKDDFVEPTPKEKMIMICKAKGGFYEGLDMQINEGVILTTTHISSVISDKMALSGFSMFDVNNNTFSFIKTKNEDDFMWWCLRNHFKFYPRSKENV